MNTTFWVNFFGVLGIISTVLIYQQKKQTQMLWWKILTDALWIVHYLLLGATSVAAVTLVAIFRSVILLCQDHAWARSKAWLWIFLATSLLMSILAWQNWTSILTTVGSLLCIVMYWIGKPKVTRIGSIPAAILFLVNVALNGSFWGTLDESFILVSAVVGIVRLDIPHKNNGQRSQEQ